MLRQVVLLLFSAGLAFAQANTDLSGAWAFTHMNGRFGGTIVLHQTGIDLTGTWHTSTGKIEPDTSVIGRVDGFTIVLTRFIGDNQQNFVLTLSPDGAQMEGFGDGWFLKHGNLNMQRLSAKDAAARQSSPRTSSAGNLAGRHSTAQSSSRGATASPLAQAITPPSTTKPAKQRWMGITVPPPRGSWRWVIQSVVTRGNAERKYSSFYYEASTDRSMEQPLSLPSGGEIVGVFPDDCAFSVRDEAGHAFTFQNGDQAIARGFGPGTWSVFPLKCGGIAVYVR